MNYDILLQPRTSYEIMRSNKYVAVICIQVRNEIIIAKGIIRGSFCES